MKANKKYVNFYDESKNLAKSVLGDLYTAYLKREYTHRQSGKNPKSFIVMSEKMKNLGYRLVFFTNLDESCIRFDKIYEAGNRGRNLIPESLINVNPHEYTPIECRQMFDNIVNEFILLGDSK